MKSAYDLNNIMENIDMDKYFNPVVMAGGVDIRLWPLSHWSSR